MNKTEKEIWLEVLTPEQRELRKLGRYDEIQLTPQQEKQLGKRACCWIESPQFFWHSRWVS